MTSETTKAQAVMRGAAGIPGERRRRRAAISAGKHRGAVVRRSRILSPWIEGLEDRRLLATIAWNTTVAPTGDEWNTAGNWQGGKVPGPGDTATITGLKSPGIVTLTGANDSIKGLITDSSVNLELISGSLALAAGSASTFGGPVTVESGTTLSMGTGSTLHLPLNVTLTDAGTLSFATGDTVTLDTPGCCASPAAIAVTGTGTFTASGTTFGGGGGTSISVANGGHLTASNSTFSLGSLSLANGSVLNADDLTGDTFNMPIYVPYGDVQYLGGNASFNQIEINADTMPSGTLALDAIGTNTTNLSYAFPGNFTIAAGATVAVGPNVPVHLPLNVTLTDAGTLSFATGDAVTLDTPGCCASPAAIAVTGTGTFTASGTTFGGGGGTSISVANGGHLTASNSTFSLGSLSLADGSVLNADDLTGDTFNMPIYVPYGDVQYLGGNASFNQIEINAGTVASGTVSLDAIGTNTTNLSYVFAGNFTIAAGATVAVGPNVPVHLPLNVTLTDAGTLSFATGDAVTLDTPGCCASPAAIVVTGTGTFRSVGTTFGGGGGTSISVANGGHFMASGSAFSLGSLSLANGSVLNAGDLTDDTFNMPIYVPYGDIQFLGGNASFNQIEINADTMPSGTLALDAIGTNTTNLSYVFAGNFTIAAGATVAVGPNVPVHLPLNVTLTDAGTLSFATGDAVTLDTPGCCASPAAIVVTGTGTFRSVGTTFGGGGGTSISVANGGHFMASGSAFSLGSLSLVNGSVLNAGDLTGDTFNMPIYVPYGDIQFLGGNASFNQIEINAGTVASGTVSLDAIGTNTTNLSYVFAGNFTIAAGATVAVGPNVPVIFGINETLTDAGTLSFATGDAVTLESPGCCASPAAIVVTGAFTASGTTFTGGGGTSISVQSGGQFSVNDSTFNGNTLILYSGSTDALQLVAFAGVLVISGGANVGTATSPTITGDDFSNVGNQGIIAVGDPNANIPLSGNYWGTTVIAQIAAKILDHNSDSTRPTIVYQPFVSGASGTSASPASTTFSPTDQTINLSATVSTTAGVAIDEGSETFTILNGTEVIGQTTAPVKVSAGKAKTTYTLPGGTAAGQYIIEASYTDNGGSYLPATDTQHFLTVSPAATVTTTTNAAATFDAASDQTIDLSAQVSSTAGTVNEGIVTFTILSGGNPVGSPVIENVSGDTARGKYTLLAGTSGGSYTIQAVYTDPIDFSTSTGTNTLTVAAAATTVAPSDASTNFNAVSGEGITLSANVGSTAGTVNQGAVTFRILDASSNQVGSTTINVVKGIASGNYVLPAGTAVGTYVIEATYRGTPSYAASVPTDSSLTISGSTTTTTASNASVAFNTTGETANLTASVASPGGTVAGGQVTFTILAADGKSPIGTATSVDLTGGPISTTYALPAGTAIGTYTIQTVYSGSVSFQGSTDTTHTLTVTEPPPAQLAIHTGPPSNALAGQPFATATQPIVVYEEDQNGNLEAGDNSTVVTLTLGSGTGPLIGTFTATVVGGVATFANLQDNTAETITLTFSSGNLTPATSDPIVVGAAAGSKLFITRQPSPTATAGQVFAAQPIVEEVDPFGNVITGDSTSTVTAARGGTGTSSLLGNTLTVTLVKGVATFAGLSYNTAELMDIAFTSSVTGIGQATSDPVVVAPTTPSQLVINKQPSSKALVGQPFPTQPVIYEEDQFGNLETGDSTTQVTALLASGSGPLQGPATVTLSRGVARFSGLYDNTAETITLDFASGTILSAASDPIVVGAAAAANLVIHTSPSATATAGQAFAVQPVLYLVDANGNLETGDNSTRVTVSLAAGAGPLKGTTTVTVQGGIATFTDLYDKTAETIALSFAASSGGLTAGPSTSIVVSPDVAAQLAFGTQPSSTATAGAAFATQPVIYEQDQFGNLETGDSTSTVTAALGGGAGQLQGTLKVTMQGGVASFSGLNDQTAGTIRLVFLSGSLVSPASSPIVVGPGVAAALAIQIQPYAQVTAGNPLTDPIDVAEVDQFGNVIASDNTTQVTASLASGSGKLIGTAMVTMQGGIASFDDLENDTAGSLTLRFSAGTLAPVVSNPSIVQPAPATQLSVVLSPGGISSGTGFPLEVDALDPFGNVANSFTGPVTLSSTNGGLSGTLTATASDGVARFTSVVSTTTGNIAVTASSNGLTSGTSSTIPVGPPAPSKLVIHVEPPQVATAGQAFATTARPVVVYEENPYGDLASSDNSTTVTAFLASGAGPLQGTLTATLVGGVATFTNLAVNAAGTITLGFTGGGFNSLASVPIVVSSAAPSRLVIQTQPSATALAGQAFAAQPVVYEVDPYGNVVTSDNSTAIAVSLASGSGPLQGTQSVTVKGGVAAFTDLADTVAETIALDFRAGALPTISSNPIKVAAEQPTIPPIEPPPPPPSLPPTITGERVLTAPVKGKKRKPVVLGFELQYSRAMNATTAGAFANYTVWSAITRRVKRKTVTTLRPVALTARYDPATHSVTLTLSRKQGFATGGKIMVNYAPGGVSDTDGTPLSSNDGTFTIAPKGSGVTLP